MHTIMCLVHTLCVHAYNMITIASAPPENVAATQSSSSAPLDRRSAGVPQWMELVVSLDTGSTVAMGRMCLYVQSLLYCYLSYTRACAIG